jgi:hypothetical protein
MRIQHPQVLQRSDGKGTYLFFRYWLDEERSDGSNKSTRKFHRIGPSHGAGALTQQQAEATHDCVLGNLSASLPHQVLPTVPPAISEHGAILFGQLAEMWRKDYVNNPKICLAGPTRYNYINRAAREAWPALDGLAGGRPEPGADAASPAEARALRSFRTHYFAISLTASKH